MTVRVVGAGLPRTGTLSLKGALERLLGAPSYHMNELLQHPEHVPTWADAFEGRPPDWDVFLADYAAAVDWPAGLLWRELSEAFPDALVLLSVRATPEQWWNSVNRTIFPRIRQARGLLSSGDGEPPAGMVPEGDPEVQAATGRMFRHLANSGFADVVDDKDAAMAMYDKHLAEVRATVPPGRLLEWQAADGWPPLCEALGVPVPDEPFPSANSSEEFQNTDWSFRRTD